LGVVVVGILINILAAYIKPKFDVFLGYISRSIRDKNEEKRKLWDETVKRLSADYNYRLIFYSKINYDFLECLFFTLVGTAIYVATASLGDVPLDVVYKIVPERHFPIYTCMAYATASLCSVIGVAMYLNINWRSIKLREAERINNENYR
jgi:hypothetical protein